MEWEKNCLKSCNLDGVASVPLTPARILIPKWGLQIRTEKNTEASLKWFLSSLFGNNNNNIENNEQKLHWM